MGFVDPDCRMVKDESLAAGLYWRSKMRIDVVGRHLEVTQAIHDHAHNKLSKLPRYFDGTQQITLTISKQSSHGHDEFEVELVVDVEKHDNFVSRVKGDDIYGLIDQATQKLTRQLTDFKEKLKLGHR